MRYIVSWYIVAMQTEYNVQQVGELHKSGVGVRKQKCLEAGTENAEVGGGSDMWRQIVPNFRAGDRKCPIADQGTSSGDHDAVQ